MWHFLNLSDAHFLNLREQHRAGRGVGAAVHYGSVQERCTQPKGTIQSEHWLILQNLSIRHSVQGEAEWLKSCLHQEMWTENGNEWFLSTFPAALSQEESWVRAGRGQR